MLSVLPLDMLTKAGNINSLTRLGRVARLYKLVRLTRMVRLFRKAYKKNMVMKYLYNTLRINAALQRLMYMLIVFVIFWHVFACLW